MRLLEMMRTIGHHTTARRVALIAGAVLTGVTMIGVVGAAPSAFGVELPEPPAPVNAGIQTITLIDHGNGSQRFLTVASCPEAGWCAVGNESGQVIELDDNVWSKPVQVFSADDSVDGLSCTSASFCMAVSYLGGWSEMSGGSWSKPKTSLPSGGGLGVSCPTASYCVAEQDAWGSISQWSGGAWTTAYDGEPDANDGLGQTSSPISCPAGNTSLCMYVTNNDYETHWNGETWTATSAISSAAEAAMVSCALEPRTTTISGGRAYPATSADVCQVVDYNGDSYWWNGSSWTSLGHPDAGTTFDSFEGLSCVYYLCAAIDEDGNVLYQSIDAGGAGSWGKPHSMDAKGEPTSISCADYSFCLAVTATGYAVTLDPQLTSKGYWLASADGSVLGYGGALSLGGASATSADPVVGIAATPTGNGYFVVTRNGTVTTRGDAVYAGDLPGLSVDVSDIVGIAPTADGRGYWLVAADGGEFAFGDAHFHGSLPGIGVHVDDVAGMVATPDGSGYLMVGSDGGVFAFGARFHGSLPSLGVHVDDIVGILPTGGEAGYVLVGRDGGAFVFGHGSGFYGSLPGEHVTVDDVVGIGLTPDQHGYWMCGTNGTVWGFGDAPVFTSNSLPDTPVAAIAGT
jgi:hypothetical protein